MEKKDPRLMRALFSTVAPRYDFITRALSYGMDGRWKRCGVERTVLPPHASVLDLASGTGDFSRLARRRAPDAKIVAADLTERMLRLARARGVEGVVCANALALPFPTASFDAVFIGYGLRNFPDLKGCLREIARVIRSGGVLVSLDFYLPPEPLQRRLYLAWLYLQGAFWGSLLHGRPHIYTYIPDSLRSFLSMDDLSRALRAAGFAEVRSRAYIFGGIGLHWAAKE